MRGPGQGIVTNKLSVTAKVGYVTDMTQAGTAGVISVSRETRLHFYK